MIGIRTGIGIGMGRHGAMLNYTAEYKAVLAAVTGTKPSFPIQVVQNNFVKTLVDGGVWPKIPCIIPYFAGMPDAQDALIWWNNPSRRAVVSAIPPAYTVGKGFTGDKPNVKYINTKFNPAIDGIGLYTRDSAAFCKFYTNNSDSSAIGSGLSSIASDTNQTIFVPRFNGKSYSALNSSVADYLPVPSSDIHDIFFATRNISSEYKLYKRKSLYQTISAASLPLIDGECYSLGIHTLPSTVSNLGIDTFGLDVYSGYLTDSEISVFVDAIEELYKSVNSINYNWIEPVWQGAGVCLSFDDISRIPSWITADAVLKQYNWKASFAINAASLTILGGVQYTMNQLLNSGHEIMNHSKDHLDWKTYLLTHTPQEFYDTQIQPLQDNFNLLEGWKPTTFAYHQVYGASAPLDDHVLSKDIFQRTRSYMPDEYLIDANNTNPNIYGADGYAIYYKNGNWDALLSAVDRAFAENKILTFLGHTIGTTTDSLTMPISVLEALCQKVVGYGMKFYRIKDIPVKRN